MKKETQTRTGLTEEKVLIRPKYKNILNVLLSFQNNKTPCREKHLAGILVKNHEVDEKYKKQIRKIKSNKVTELIEQAYKEKEITEEEYKKARKILQDNVINKYHYPLSKIEPQFDSIYGLRRSLQRLRKLGMVTSKSHKKDYSSIILTEKGMDIYLKHIMNRYMSLIKDTRVLMCVNELIVDIVMLQSQNKEISKIVYNIY